MPVVIITLNIGLIYLQVARKMLGVNVSLIGVSRRRMDERWLRSFSVMDQKLGVTIHQLAPIISRIKTNGILAILEEEISSISKIAPEYVMLV
jgi:hypothetical protein